MPINTEATSIEVLKLNVSCGSPGIHLLSILGSLGHKLDDGSFDNYQLWPQNYFGMNYSPFLDLLHHYTLSTH